MSEERVWPISIEPPFRVLRLEGGRLAIEVPGAFFGSPAGVTLAVGMSEQSARGLREALDFLETNPDAQHVEVKGLPARKFSGPCSIVTDQVFLVYIKSDNGYCCSITLLYACAACHTMQIGVTKK